MKKLTLLATISLLAFNTLADVKLTADKEDTKSGFYLKGHLGASKMNGVTHNLIGLSAKHKAKVSPLVSVGVGYAINDVARADITFDYMNVAFSDAKGERQVPFPQYFVTGGGEINNFKTSIHAVMINGSYDVVNTEQFNIFLGASLGYARIVEEQVWTLGRVVGTGSTPTSHNLAYGLSLGTDIKLDSNTSLEVTYSWKNYGKSKSHKSNGSYNVPANAYKGSHITTGLRFDI